MPKRSCAALPFTEKRKVLDLVRERKKKDSYAELAKIYSKNKSINEIGMKEKEIRN